MRSVFPVSILVKPDRFLPVYEITPGLCCGFASCFGGMSAFGLASLDLCCFDEIFSSFFFGSRFLRFFAEIAIFRQRTSRSGFATKGSAVLVRNAKKNVVKNNANCVVGSKLHLCAR